MPETSDQFIALLGGIVRPTVTLLFAVALTLGWLWGRLSDDAFLGLAGMAIGFWFRERERDKKAGTDP